MAAALSVAELSPGCATRAAGQTVGCVSAAQLKQRQKQKQRRESARGEEGESPVCTLRPTEQLVAGWLAGRPTGCWLRCKAHDARPAGSLSRRRKQVKLKQVGCSRAKFQRAARPASARSLACAELLAVVAHTSRAHGVCEPSSPRAHWRVRVTVFKFKRWLRGVE